MSHRTSHPCGFRNQLFGCGDGKLSYAANTLTQPNPYHKPVNSYARGYAAGPAKRISILSSLLTYPAMITLLVLPIITAAFLFNKTAPYKYK